MAPEKFNNIWFALVKTPEDAINKTSRAELFLAIEKGVKSWDVTQADAAKRLGLTRPRVNDLLRGKISKFSLDVLTALAHRAGLAVKLSVKKAGTKLAA